MADLNLGDTQLILRECEDLTIEQTAYILATSKWETAHTMKPVREYGGETYLRGKRYYPFVGRGYVQITWRENYEKASRHLGVDFIASPEKLLEPQYAAPILVRGMREGWFTGKRLSDYIGDGRVDYVGARRIVNGTDKAAQIADIARDYEAALRADGFGTKPTGGLAAFLSWLLSFLSK